MRRIGFLGPPGSFSEQAAERWLGFTGEEGELVPCPSITDVVASVLQGQVQEGIVPLENSIEGSINVTLDLLAEEELAILGEVILEIRHHLVGKSDDLAQVNVVYSHPQALAQCRRFLREKMPSASVQQTTSTSEAARVVAEGLSERAAISSANAARRFGLNIIVSDVQDYLDNKTRFVIIGQGATRPTGCDRTSLVLALPRDVPGGLYQILKEFADEMVNLTKIESRPTKKVLGEYVFFLDCEGHVEDSVMQRVLDKLKAKTVLLKVLGSYPRDEAGEANGPKGK
ncbi:MAG: prephenate dehydratase [Bacillota bacterium]